MATTNELVTRAKLILSRRNDTLIDAAIITELGARQEVLEREAHLPNFLYTRQTITVTTDEVDLETALTRFNRLHREAGGITYRVSDPNATEPFVKLRRFSQLEHLVENLPGALGAGSSVSGYFLVDRLLTLRPYPSVAAPQDLKIHFYQSEPSLPAVGNSTIWTQKAGDLLLGEAGLIIAQSLRDQNAIGLFKALADKDRARIYKRDVSEDEADLDRSMGDDD